MYSTVVRSMKAHSDSRKSASGKLNRVTARFFSLAQPLLQRPVLHVPCPRARAYLHGPRLLLNTRESFMDQDYCWIRVNLLWAQDYCWIRVNLLWTKTTVEYVWIFSVSFVKWWAHNSYVLTNWRSCIQPSGNDAMMTSWHDTLSMLLVLCEGNHRSPVVSLTRYQ